MNALDNALNAFDLDTYMRYNGVKNIFRELHDELGDDINSMSDEELKAKVNDYFDSKVYNYEIDNSNVNNQLSEDEKKDILREIKTINKAKRSLIDTGGDFLYIIDHTDRDGLNHLQNGQEGFLVKEIIDIRGLNREQINEIKNNYENDRGDNEATRRLESWLERNGYKQRVLNSNSIDSKDRETNSYHDGLDSKTQEGKSLRGQSSQNSQDDFSGGQIKTGYDGTNHPRYMDVDAAKKFINSMSAKDLRDELNLVKQESADYDLVNGVEEKPKRRSFKFDFEKPKTQVEKDLEAIKTNDWNLPEEVRNKVESKLNDYIGDKSKGEVLDVAVSRATDTVTVISNNIKKKGSPLHPEATKFSNTEEHKTPVNPKGNAINTTPQRSDNEITKQVVEHLKSIPGINVLGRNAMAEFLKTHNLKFLQQLINPFGKKNPYENSKHRNKISEILSVVKANKYNNPGTDVVTLDSDNNKVLYLIDHSSDKELADNLKDGDGFGIRKVYNIDKLSNDDIKEIIRNISPAYEYSTARVLHALQTIGLGQKHLSGIDIAAELKRAADSNDVFHGKNRGIWSQRWVRYDNSSSRESSGNEGDLGKEGIETFTTPQGEVYGFVDKDGNIYLDETKISPEHPIHEYTYGIEQFKSITLSFGIEV